MSLSTLAGSLLAEAGALVLNCCCLDRNCGGPCLRDWDCDFFPDCICINGNCEPAEREECPPGYTEIPLDDGSGLVRCEPNCTGEPCANDDDCDEGCVCVDGRCVPSSDAFFCIDGECKRGNDIVYDPSDPDKPAGPYPTYEACCMSPDEDGKLCGCGFACTDSCNCIPSETQVDFEDYQECRAECCDPDDSGRCCYNEVIKDAAGNLLVVRWYDCANSLNEDCEDGPIESYNGGTRQITATFSKGSECRERPPGLDPNLPWGEGCPIPEYGACCIIDGQDVVDCIEETKAVCDDMPNRPGDFPQYPPGFTTDSKSTTWSDCTTSRNQTLNEDYACDDCNGEKDCACATDERCDLRECVTCYDDTDPSKLGKMVRAQAGVDRQIGDVTKGETVSFYIRNCVSDALGVQSPVTDRRAIIKINGTCGDSSEQEITDDGQIQVTYSGEMYVTGVAGIPDVQVCLTLERDNSTFPNCSNCTYDVVNDSDNQGVTAWEQTALVIGVEGIANWADGWPNCAGQNNLVMTLTRRGAENVNANTVSAEEVRTLWLCDNGSYTDVTSVAVDSWLSAGFVIGCIGGGNVAVAPQQTKDHVTYTYDRAFCRSSDTWNAYGNLPDKDLPDADRWNCPQTRLPNPLP